MRIAVITPIPTPYRDPFWQCFSELPDVELMVIYCAQGKADRPWGGNDEFTFQREFPRSVNLARHLGHGASCYCNPLARSILKKWRPDAVIVGGYNHVTMLEAVRYCNRNDTPWFLQSESWRERSGLAGKLKERLLVRWLRSASGGLPTGQLAGARLKSLGMKSSQLTYLPNVPDISELRCLSIAQRANFERSRSELGLRPNELVVLFAARMIEKKRPALVVRAFAELKRANAKLIMLGDGPLLQAVKELSVSLGTTDQIEFKGFIPHADVIRWMSVADVFVQPSRETWGVAPIEALACGCAVVLSKEVGCAEDISAGSEKVKVLSELSPSQLANVVLELESQSQAGSDSPWLEQHTYHRLAQRLLEAMESVT